MIRVVLDTNILVSAFWSKDGNAACIVRLFIEDKLVLIYSREILAEYKIVLSRPAFQFRRVKIGEIINHIRKYGILVNPSVSDIPFTDESDRKFFDAANTYSAILITGNQKHYPESPLVQSTAEFLAGYNR
jgi:putative PIN family toxin of toxin-antitoxin system